MTKKKKDGRTKRKGEIRSTNAWFADRIPAQCLDLLEEMMLISGESRGNVIANLIETAAEIMSERKEGIQTILERPDQYYIDRKRKGLSPFPPLKKKK